MISTNFRRSQNSLLWVGSWTRLVTATQPKTENVRLTCRKNAWLKHQGGLVYWGFSVFSASFLATKMLALGRVFVVHWGWLWPAWHCWCWPILQRPSFEIIFIPCSASVFTWTEVDPRCFYHLRYPRWWCQIYVFLFTPIWGRFPFWLNICPRLWNHQLDFNPSWKLAYKTLNPDVGSVRLMVQKSG